MFYIYTGQRVIVINKVTGSIEASILVGQTGYLAGFEATIEKTHKLAFDIARNFIYCANEDDELLVINCNTNEIVPELTITCLYPLYGSFINYNQDLDLIYWVQNRAHIDEESHLIAIDPEYMEAAASFATGSGHRITDITFNDQNNYLLLSTEDYETYSGSVHLLDPLILTTYDEEIFQRKVDMLLFVKELNRLSCLTKGYSGNMLEAFTINLETHQLSGLPSFSIFNFPLYDCSGYCYNYDSGYAYFSGKGLIDNKLVIIDFTSLGSPIVAQHQLAGVKQVLYSESNNRVYSSGESLTRLNGFQIEEEISIKGLTNHLIQAGDQVVISNIDGSSCQSYSLSLDPLHHIQLGDAVLKGVLNSTWQKIYWVSNTTKNPESFVTVLNLSDNSVFPITIGGGIRDLTYHSGSEKLIVSNWYGTEHQLTIIDGQTNNPQILPSGNINILHSGENFCTYLGGGNLLSYLDMTSFTIHDIQNNLSQPYFIWGFVNNKFGNCIVLAVENYSCKLLEIDNTTNQVIGTYPFQINPLEHNGLKYNDLKNELYLLSGTSVTIVDASNYSIIETLYTPSEVTVKNCHFSQRNNRLIITDAPGNSSRILFYDATTFEFLNEIQFTPNEIILSSIYNSHNDLLYVHTLRYDWDLTFKNEIRVRSYRISDFELHSNTYLEQNHVKNSWISNSKERMVLGEDGRKLYIPNMGLGNISIVECASDQIVLKPETINWISFPRLERDNNDPVLAQPVLENIDPFPDHLSMTNLPPQEEEKVSIEYANNQWIPSGLTHIQSTRGYKLETSNTELSFLRMEGTQLDPAYPLTIYEGFSNWVGYYPTWSQDPFDALAEALDDLTLIIHHDWACIKEWGPIQNPEPYWICANGKKPLKYGDMLILETDQDVTFQWGGSSAGGYHDMPLTEYYSYTEKADYTPIFIDLDSTDNPVEIGAFIADSCIGATVVEEGDTLVMIRGYMPDDTAGEIAFEEYYGTTKSASGRIDQYYVLNTNTYVREKRVIHSGDNKKYYHVSFEKEEMAANEISPLALSIYPNPCMEYSRIGFYIPEPSKVNFEIMDIFGRKISETIMGDLMAGHYTELLGDIHPKSITPGIYLLRMSACGTAATKKFIINR
jgi:hypothetical protein